MYSAPRGALGTALVTGASRGIGLEAARELAARGYGVVACTRGAPPTALAAPVASSDGAVVARQGVEVTDADALRALAATLPEGSLDLLVCNAGVLTRQSWADAGEWDYAEMRSTIDVNAMGPLITVLLVSSLMGSLADNTSGGMYAYRMSKAAANMAFVSLAKDLGKQGVAVGIVHPGFVNTDMTGPYGGGGISAEAAGRGVADRAAELTLETAGRMVAGKTGKVEEW
eukprot:PRCOL_00002389-RA